jgi:ribonuclease HII
MGLMHSAQLSDMEQAIIASYAVFYVKALNRPREDDDSKEMFEEMKEKLIELNMNVNATDVFHVMMPPNEVPLNFLNLQNMNEKKAINKLIEKVEEAKNQGFCRFFILVSNENDPIVDSVDKFSGRHSMGFAVNKFDQKCLMLTLSKPNEHSSLIFDLFVIICVICFAMIAVVFISTE